MYMAQKAKKKSKLRHAEYYDMQKTFDSLYADSKSGEVFGHLMDIISAPNNIKLAFRNIKGNDGSHTAGTDGRTIESLAVMSEDKFVKLIQKQFRRYEPKAVKRVEIPKPNGKMRPLGIPCIIDRIVQQCILQVMEPICEAKFYEHSYGFRPCRSAENAISYAYGLAQRNKLHYVVDVDVKGFFDNVDHRKLLKQIWTLGIRDTKLIQIIKAMLKAPIEMPDGENVLPSKGTPQGGILSPLLANIVLNELDWWIASQWDEMVRHMKHPCKVTYYPNGAEKKCNSYTALKKSNLKEMRIVRYADDFKIFCRTKEDAEKTYYAVKDWLWKRLKLEVSDEKSKVTNLRKRDSEFLGFRIKLRRKSNSWVITSNVCDKAIHRIGKEMADSVKAIQSSKTAEEISLNVGDYNAKVIGVQDYYCIATRVNLNFSDIARPINGQLLHRIDGIKKQGEIKNRYLRKRYGKSKQMRWIGETPLVPLAYVQFKIPMRKSRKINPYTPEGRAEIHDNLRIDVNSMLWLMRHPIPTESVRYNDNRVSLYAGQDGKCAITGKKLDVQTCICYRKTNNCKKSNDSYQNLLLLSLQGLAIVSSEDMMSVAALVKEYSLNAKVITKVNKLRATAGLPLLAAK
ncbi:MAG: group II intron reverse transcriptase/maturase [Christensenellales bacterium]